MATTRSKKEIYLVGSSSNNITGARLPSRLQVLKVFFHFHSELNLTVRESATNTVDLVLPFWEKAGIPTRAKQHVISKLEEIFYKWKSIQKNKSRRSGAQIQKEVEFTHCSQELFDIAHEDALQLITIQEDKDFLIAQRDGRRGCMTSVDEQYFEHTRQKEVKKQKEVEITEKRIQKSEAVKRKLEEMVELESSTDESDDEESEDDDEYSATKAGCGTGPSHTSTRAKRARKNVITPQLAFALDRCKISDRKAVFITAATSASLGQDTSELNINRSSISRARRLHRSDLAFKLKEEFHTDVPLTVHWDGKLLPDLTGKEKVDRLPILVSGAGVEQLLAVPKLPNGTGEATASAVFETIQDWGINEISCMAFDTTSANTGLKSGACTLLEQKMGRRLLSLAYRHHVLEVILEHVFKLTLGASSGPDVLLFMRFQNQWGRIDQGKFRTGLDDKDVSLKLTDDIKEEVLTFAQQQLEEIQPREDYRELLHLIIIFLGGIPPGGISFRAPAGLHRARWMARLLYGFKIFMLSRQTDGDGLFKITGIEEKGLRELLCFAIAGGYIQAWFSAPIAAMAPRNDLKLLERLQTYSEINQGVADGAIHKLLGHLWYLSEELIGLAFFDPLIPLEEKRAMQKALQEAKGTEDPPKRIKLQPSDLAMIRTPSSFVTQQTKGFFSALGLSAGFLHKDPEVWLQDKDYGAALEIVKGLKVVNDTAERGVALIQEFNDHITRNETQKQYLLQVVSEHRKLCPDAKKSTVLAALK